MTQQRKDVDALPARLQHEARAYHEPPTPSGSELDQMWLAIEESAFPQGALAHTDRFTRGQAPWWAARRTLPIAAALLVGVALGRVSTGRMKAPTSTSVVARTKGDSVVLAEPYQTTTSRYLGQTAALLVALPAEVKAGRTDAHFIDRAHDLLLTTRLLLDSPAASDPRLRTLLDDLELVLAQVVRLQAEQRPGEMELIRQALEQRDVLPRLRTAAADISADD
ncbi:MAG TPA: hypothetical protein VJ867_06075 [Gemmatimonadaceae bacterium]|nr:hypothetical protein [Gemmatimonadaceae bacterium]